MTTQGPKQSRRTIAGAIQSLGLLTLAALAALLAFGGFIGSANAQTEPTLTATGANALYVENQATAASLFSGASASTSDAGQSFSGMTVQVTNSPDGNSERLFFGTNGASVQFTSTSTVDGNITATASRPTLDTATVVFTFATPLSELDFAAFVDSLEYRHFGNDVSDGTRTISVSEIVDTGADVGSPNVVSSVAVSAVNDNPVLGSLPTSVSVVEGVASDVDLSAASYGDVDGRSGTQMLTITASEGTLSGVDAGGVVASAPAGPSLTLSGTSQQINVYLNTASNIQYTSASPPTGVPTLSFTANDGGNTGTGGPLGFIVPPPTVDIIVEQRVLVCVTKAYGPNAGFADPIVHSPDQFTFNWSVSVDGQVVDNGSEAPTAGNECAVDGASAISVYAPPGSTVAVTETVPVASMTAPAMGPAQITCVTPEIPDVAGEMPVETTGPPTAWSITTPESGGQVNCELTNDSVVVCINKTVGDTAAVLANPLGGDAPWTFPLISLMAPAATTDTVQDCLGTAYVIAPGAPFNASELVRSDLADKVGLIDASCAVVDDDPPFQAGADGSVMGTAPGEQNGRINCDFENDSVLVCVAKELGAAAATEFFNTDFVFTVTAGDTAIAAADQSEQSFCAFDDETAFFMPPGLGPIVISETIPASAAGKVALVERDGCGGSATLNDDGSITLPTTNEGTTYNCTFTNDSVVVCVQKAVGPEASAINTEQTNINEGFMVEVSSGDTDILAARQFGGATDPCDYNGLGFSFLVAPESEFTITETAPDGSLLRPTSFSCPDVVMGTISGSTASVSQLPSISVDDDEIPAVVNCTLTNDVRVLCVVKYLGDGAVLAGYDDSTEFTFDVSQTGGPAVLSLPGDATTYCDFEDDEDEPGRAHVEAFAFAPGAEVTIQEVDNSTNPAPIEVSSIWCADVFDDPIEGFAPDFDAASVTFDDFGSSPLNCGFENDTTVICVSKAVTDEAADALAAGAWALSDVQFEIKVGDTVVGGPTNPAAQADDALCQPQDDTIAVAGFTVPAADSYTVTELVTPGAPVGAVFISCDGGSALGNTVTFTPPAQVDDMSTPNRYKCRALNSSVEVTVLKEVTNDDGLTMQASDFVLDAYDADGAAIRLGMSTGDTFYVAPGATFTVSERAAEGYSGFASCADTEVLEQPLPPLATTSHTAGDSATAVQCTFVNDDIPEIPVCAMQTFDEGNSGLTLDDFTLELFDGGAVVAMSVASAAPDPLCAAEPDVIEETDNTSAAGLLPGNMVLLGMIRPDGGSYSFVSSADDPNSLVVFDPSSCMVEESVLRQTIRSAAPAMFTAGENASRVVCLASARAEVRVERDSSPSGVRGPDTELPVPQAQPISVPAAQSAPPIAVTGVSTTDLPLPLAFALMCMGLTALAARRHRNQL